jgi:hypothetical protein
MMLLEAVCSPWRNGRRLADPMRFWFGWRWTIIGRGEVMSLLFAGRCRDR